MRWALAIALAACASCSSSERTIAVRFQNKALRDSVTEVRVFAYDLSRDPSARCARFEPRGLPPGDAEERTGKEPDQFRAGALGDVIGMIEDLPSTSFTLIFEGWDIRAADRPGAASIKVLRGYACVELDLRDLAADKEAGVNLAPLAPVGAKMQVPGRPLGTARYDASYPLVVADGAGAGDRFIVQLLDADANELAGTPIAFRVVEGSGALAEISEASTATRALASDEHGIAAVTLQAGANASGVNGGKIVVEAYAPGFDGSPLRFEARAVPSFEAELEVYDVPHAAADLADGDPVFRPVLAADFDGNGRADVATFAGRESHRLVILYGTGPHTYALYVSEPRPRLVLAATPARLEVNRPPSIVGFSSTIVGGSPEREVWRNPGTQPIGGRPAWTPTATTAPMTAISATAADLDGDGLDELGLTRCANPLSGCVAESFEETRSELAVFKNLGGGRFQQRAAIPTLALSDAGYRTVRFADLDGDGSLDLCATTLQQVVAFCGDRRLTNFGYDRSRRAFQNITFGHGYGLAVGKFDADEMMDVVATGGLRSGGPVAGLKVLPGCRGCAAGGLVTCGLDRGIAEDTVLGPRTEASQLAIESADLNGDGNADTVALHRELHTLITHLGGGNGKLALGPSIALPSANAGGLAVFTEAGGDVVIATVIPVENRVVLVRARKR